MAYYYVKIYNCRINDEPTRTGEKGAERVGAPVFEWTSGNEVAPGSAAGNFVTAFEEHSLFRYMDIPVGTVSAAMVDYDDPADGAWSTNYGKGVYAYKVGYSVTSGEQAKAVAVYKNLS